VFQLRDSEKETDEGLAEKESRLVDEKDNAEKEATQAEDKLATTLYTLQAKEKDLALNIVDSLKTLQTFFRSVLNHLDQDIPALEEKVKNSAKTRVYGEDLAAHLRSHKRSIATPLSLGVKGLKNNLTEEGLFRFNIQQLLFITQQQIHAKCLELKKCMILSTNPNSELRRLFRRSKN